VIVCSCSVTSGHDIEMAVAEIMSGPTALLPTPGVVFRHLKKRMICTGCAPMTVAVIYAAMDRLSAELRISPYELAAARAKLEKLEERRKLRDQLAQSSPARTVRAGRAA
jgi:hypothetical protein